MGIYDREYYRGETHGSGWLTGLAPATKAIIVINVIVFFLQPILQDRGLWNYFIASSDGIFRHGYVWQLLTATFMHAGVYHLLWNMVFLWMVGREMESFYGTRDFVAFYLCAAVLSTLGWVAIDTFLGHHGNMLGASGAIMAVVVVYAMYYPHREILLFFVLPVQMWLLVVIYLAHDAYQLLTQPASEIAVASHLSGAAFGYLFKHFDLRWSRFSWRRVTRPRLRLISPEPREKPTTRSTGPTWSPNPATSLKPSTTAVLPEEQLDARLDEVLAKIAREGRGGLTEEENRVLQEASRRARNRRSDRI
ncbi:putative membrane protein [Singulisphaera acidiphila DSM 18658]|uniref:Putative membrane protein n=2 Tax=Singulisphaera acidiphila TaxID=466153 RepID=L0DKQ2_SINAD|nr:putative membrane protein [Singulisphaera acidiphila DSM 18658]